MSIYVKVGDEVIAIMGERSEDGRHASSPISIDVLRRQLDTATTRREVARRLAMGAAAADPTTLQQEAAAKFKGGDARLSFGGVAVTPLDGGIPGRPAFDPPARWRRVRREHAGDGDRWVQVTNGQVVAELSVDEVADELNAMLGVRSAQVTVRVGSEDVTVCAPVDQAIPVDVIEREIAQSRLRQAGTVPVESGDLTELTDALGRGRLTAEAFSAGPTSADVCPPFRSRRLNQLRWPVAQVDPFAELAKWRRWASALLKDDGFQDDERRRKRIAAVLEAPSAMPDDVLPREVGDPVVEACARVAHEVYRAGLCDPNMLEWDLAPEAERTTARESVVAALSGITPEEWHERWRAKMAEDGWAQGPAKDEEHKRHPNLVPYGQLPPEQRMIDQMFSAAALATARAVSDLEDAYAVPVLKVRGDLTPEQFAAFRREWERQVAAAPDAWKTPIFDVPVVAPPLSSSPYTRSGMISFIDAQVDSMLREPLGSLREVELQVVLLLEVRGFVVAGRVGADAVVEKYEGFVAGVVGASASASSLAEQLEAAGRSGEFVDALRVFVAARRTEP